MVLQIIGIYFFVGVTIYGVYELITKNISRTLPIEVKEVQQQLLSMGVNLNERTLTIIYIVVMIVFYPYVIYHEIKDSGLKDTHK